MKLCGVAPCKERVEFPLVSIRHANLIDVYEGYQLDDEITAIVDYVSFSLEDLLQRSLAVQLVKPTGHPIN